ncbi:MAG: HEAT repeat domain-containing protein [Thermosynechococcaceae cyanobacterium]
MADPLSELIQAVAAADNSESLLEAVVNLAEARLEGAIPELIAALSYNNPGAAVAAVDGLIQLGELAVVPIMEQLDRHNYTARAWATRAMAGIGDPRGLVTLLDAATSDITMSVRRAAARGLGAIKWHWFPGELLDGARQEALSALLFVVQKDEEWVVRYAAIVGLQMLAEATPELRSPLLSQFERMAASDSTVAVCARAQMAHHQLQASLRSRSDVEERPSPLTAADWQRVQEELETYRKTIETNAESFILGS